ncbi:leucyl/phenylalanyl-tRNA--protein transferase [Croceibacter atlanticus]|uniref:leucyl/phenylalanyl-tRNA--protein transferase n=1 Tax=Croceibacter atlanticus TaxID=313588 RepID=UPI002E11329C|nr:leucyl/phenylalanyl-tRNA--protein transferase [Croceibacter atlanticus]
MYLLDETLWFPNPSEANQDGLLAVGGNLSPERLLLAYNSGIFPWFNDDEMIMWWSPNPRMVMFPKELKVHKSMRQLFNQQKFKVTYNTHFKDVITACSEIERPDQDGTWITSQMIDAYTELHLQGVATSVEVWQDNLLVGGLYGIYLKDKQLFCGESMFTKVSNASKYGFISLVRKLESEGVKLIDCQMHTNHLERLGAKEISRESFLEFLK